MRVFLVLIIRAVLWAFAIAVGGGLRAQTPSYPTQLRPLPRSSALTLATGGVNPTNVAIQVVDPRLQKLFRWLQPQAGVLPLPNFGLPLEAQRHVLDQLRRQAADAEVRFRKENGTPLQVRGTVLEPAFAGPVKAPADRDEWTARSFLRANRALLLINDPDNEWVFKAKETDGLGRRHLRFAQIYQGLPVWPCELIVHLDRAGNVDLMDGAFIPTPVGVATKAGVTADEAKRHTRQELPGGQDASVGAPELIIYGPLEGPPRLAWKVELTVGLGRAWRVVVDAVTGGTLLTIDLIQDAAETGTGVDSAGQTRPLNLWHEGNTYYLFNTSKPMFDATSTPPDLKKTKGAIIIIDAKNTPPTANPDKFADLVLATSASATSGWVPDAVGAAYGVAETYDFYRERFGRNSLDGQGGSIIGIVRYGVNFPNAYWNGQSKIMVFGDGYPKGIDVAGHEMTHGVLNSIGNGGILEYHDQSGALNEALADMLGEMVESRSLGQPDWLKGNHLGLSSGPIQNYASPGVIEFAAGRKNPSKMSEFVQLANAQKSDNGGVHINSSIINHAFYLLAQGPEGAIGLRDTEQIFYRAMTLHLQKQSQFIDMRHACATSAEELFGRDSTQARKTAQAFDAVEILEAPVTPTRSSIPAVQAADSTLYLRYNPFLGIYLVRREDALRDPAAGTPLNTVDFLARRRVSVSGNGQVAVFVSANFDAGVIATDGSGANLAGVPGEVYSVAMSPDGTRYAFVQLDFFGQPSNEIGLLDFLSKTPMRTIRLYAPGTEGTKLDIVKFADTMDFTADGQTLIYDAYSEFRTKEGAVFGAWTLYALDLATETITMLIDLNEGLDFGNPKLGRVNPHLVTYEVIDKKTGLSTIFAGDLQSGKTGRIAAMNTAGLTGVPCYTGDDSAIVYSQGDNQNFSGYSLMRQPLASDGITPAGNSTLWAADAGFGVLYRRGTFVASNAPPQVQLLSPMSNQTFAPAAQIPLQATATDSDGSVAKVEFYAGSIKLGEDVSAPYGLSWSTASSGRYRLFARAIDNLGGATDSTAVEIVVGAANQPPAITSQPQSQTTCAGSSAVFQVAASGSAPLNYQWRKNGVNLSGATSAVLNLVNLQVDSAADFTVVVSNSAGTVTSQAARMTVDSAPTISRKVRLRSQAVMSVLK